MPNPDWNTGRVDFVQKPLADVSIKNGGVILGEHSAAQSHHCCDDGPTDENLSRFPHVFSFSLRRRWNYADS